DDLARTAARLVRDHQAHVAEEARLAALFEGFGLVGNSPALREVFRRALKAAHFSDLPVLLLGETGTGKQRLAEAIHALDPKRRDKPFLTVNCGAISKTLAESELFGHNRGAFSGAGSDRPGLFRAAEGGTLLLDEVGELDPELQPKLLRVLQERRLLPVGADLEHGVDVRILAATNRPLERLVEEGKFRLDLYQRLNVFQILVPPLRERPEDVEPQARHFLRMWQAEGRPPIAGISPRVLDALRLLPWEGNTRQLEGLVRAAVAHKTAGDVLEMEDLPGWALEELAGRQQSAAESSSLEDMARRAAEQGFTLAQAVDEFERRLLERVLKQTGGNRTRAATLLGLTPRTVYNKLRKHRLDG
ncbi:MAG TPA: sigma 54-interacting transcriptional regulator, partial [Gemmataceae bacterium]|nr:sigma 54-interacting transcriptional regulator [Gemmataceae bacterium]